MTIRDARPSDVAKIAALERECFSLPWPEEIIASQLSGPGKIMLAAEEEGAFSGYMGLNTSWTRAIYPTSAQLRSTAAAAWPPR